MKIAEEGKSLTSSLIRIFILIVIMLLVIKIAPIYYENYGMRSTLSAINDDINKDLDNLSYQAEFKKKFERNLEVNQTKNVSVNNLKFVEENNSLVVHLKYDVTEPLIGNIDLLLHFDDMLKVK